MSASTRSDTMVLTGPGYSPLGQDSNSNLNLEAFALFLYFYRDAFAGALRYLFAIVKLDALWFIPDLAALACIALFLQRYVIAGKSLIALLTLLYMVFSL